VLGRPALGDAADQQRPESGEAPHPRQRLLALRAQRRLVLVAAEQDVVVAQRVLDLVVAGQRAALGQPELSCRLALGERPVGDAVLGDELRGELRDRLALVAGRGERRAPVAVPALGGRGSRRTFRTVSAPPARAAPRGAGRTPGRTTPTACRRRRAAPSRR